MRYLHQFLHIMITFRIASEERIPSTMFSLMCDQDERGGGSQLPGEQFIQPTKDCRLFLAGQFDKRNFQLIDASCQKCYDRKGPNYYKVRWEWLRSDFVKNVPVEFAAIRSALSSEFETLCDDAGFSIIAYDNPYFQAGKRVEGGHSLSICANAPEWLLEMDGTPVLVWDRPKHQEGARKIPRKPRHKLGIADGGAIEIIKG